MGTPWCGRAPPPPARPRRGRSRARCPGSGGARRTARNPRGGILTEGCRDRHTPGMGQAELLIAGLLVGVAGLGALARRLSIPYPIVLVIGGALFGFVPGVAEVKLDPNVVLVIFLPPLLYSTAFFANLGDIRANLRGIALTSVGLVLLTMVAVAVVAHELVPGLPWAAAFALGAVVSPTDPLAGAAIMRRLGLPRRLVSAVEAEGLFNDATALVAYRVAVKAAIVGGGFSLAHPRPHFITRAARGLATQLH